MLDIDCYFVLVVWPAPSISPPTPFLVNCSHCQNGHYNIVCVMGRISTTPRLLASLRKIWRPGNRGCSHITVELSEMPCLDRTHILPLATVPSTPLSSTPKARVGCHIQLSLCCFFLRLDHFTHFPIYLGSAGICICDPWPKRILLTSADHAERTSCHFFTAQRCARGGRS